MGSAEVLHKNVEKLHEAHRLVRESMKMLPQCGPLSMLSAQFEKVSKTLSDLTEVAAALADARAGDDDAFHSDSTLITLFIVVNTIHGVVQTTTQLQSFAVDSDRRM